MLLSITIDTTHPDAQGDARTAIKLLQDSFRLSGVMIAPLEVQVTVDASEVASVIDDAVARVAEARTATPQPAEPMAEARGAGAPTLTPDAFANIHTGPVTASQTAAIVPSVNSPARRLIPGTDTYVTVDVNGLPWDKRIHASTQVFVADGSWRRKPKVSDEDFKRISDELHVVMTAPAAPVPTAAEAFAQSFVQTFVQTFTPSAPTSSASSFAQAFAMPAPTTFIEFMTWIGGHSHAQRLTLANVSDVMAGLGLVNAEGRGAVALIDKRPDLIPAAYQKLSALLPAGGPQ